MADLCLSRGIIESFSEALAESPPQVLPLDAVKSVSSHIDGNDYQRDRCRDKDEDKQNISKNIRTHKYTVFLTVGKL